MSNFLHHPVLRNSQPDTLNSKLDTRNSIIDTRNSILDTRYSKLATRNSQLATRNSQLATRKILLYLILFLIFKTGDVQGQQYMYKMWEHSQGLPDTVSWMAHVQDNDGNTFITGNTLVAGEKANIITTKYDRSGDEIWQVTYNSTFDDNDYGTAITLDDDGNVYVAATSFISATNQYDYRTIKYNSTGTLQWTSTYNGTGSLYDIPSDIIVDASDNVYVTGGSFGSGTGWDYATVKYNSSGTQQWVSRYNYNGNDDAASGLAINNSGRIVVTGGSAQAADNWDFASVKYNQNTGVQLDVQRNTASGLGIDRVYGFTIDGDDNIYLTGRAAISGQGYNMRTVKMDSLLTVQWSKTYDAANGDDVGYAVQVDLAGYVYVTGSITNAEGILNGFTVKYNSAGTVQWSAIETANNGSDLATWNTDLSISDDNDIVIAGTTHNGANSDIIMYIYNSDGEKQWTETWNGTGNGDDTPYFVHADINNQIYIGGKTFTGTNDTYILVRYKQVNYTTPPDDDTDKPIQLTWFENKGQIIDTEENLRSDIKYYTQRHYPALYASDDSLFMVFSRIDTSTTTEDTLARIDIGYYNSSSTKEIHHATSNGGEYLNYFLAHTGAQGITNVQQHEKLYITELYPKVDLMYYFDNAGIKYYLIIKPGYSAQQNPIQMVINGATKTINSDTTLTLTTDIGKITFRTPDAYQIDDDGSRIDLGWDATYTSVSDRIGFGLGSYTGSKVLVLEIGVGMFADIEMVCDDNVLWGTLFGGDGSDRIEDTKLVFQHPATPYLYVAGNTRSPLFPAELNFINSISDLVGDIFIEKFDPETYAPQWGVYIGGTGVDGEERSTQLSKWKEGYIAISSTTYSDDLPCLNELDLDEDVYKDYNTGSYYEGLFGILTTFGELELLTYIGGPGIDIIYGINSPEENDHLILVGRSTGGIDFPLKDFSVSSSDIYYTENKSGFIIELNDNLELVWGTLFGAVVDVYDYISDIEIDNNGDYIITGLAAGAGLPVVSAHQSTYGGGSFDAFVAKINANTKSLSWCTYYGGTGDEYSNAIAIDNDNGIYVCGIIDEKDDEFPDFPLIPISAPGYNDNSYDALDDSNESFLLKFTTSGTAVWSTYFGGEGRDNLWDIECNGSYILVTGYVSEANLFPLTEYTDAYFDNTKDANYTSIISLFDKTDLQLLWSTFIGDNTGNEGIDLSFSDLFNTVFLGGNMGYTSTAYSFRPLCDPGDPGYYQEIPEAFPFEDYKRNEGYIVHFDLSIFPDLPTSSIFLEGIDQSVFTCYPNPVHELLNLSLTENITNFYNLNIFDINGKSVFRKTQLIFDSKTPSVVDVSKFPPAMYFIQLTGNEKNYFSYFIKH